MTNSPTWSYVVGNADFASVSFGVCTIWIARLSVSGDAWFDVAVTVFASLPLPAVGEPFASSSACVNVCVAVQVIDAVGASVVSGQLRSLLSLSSLSAMPVSVTFPVFVTTYE